MPAYNARADTTNPRAVAAALAERAEEVCRRYLPRGKMRGRYWTVGNTAGDAGRSLYVRLGPPGPPGWWTDAATGERGDLLQLLRCQRGGALRPALDEAARFLGHPPAPEPVTGVAPRPNARESRRATEAPVRMWAMCRPIDGTRAEAYLRARGIVVCRFPSLRFHPTIYYRDAEGNFSSFPALVAAVTSAAGDFVGVQRTYLDPTGDAKAPVPDPRRALGRIYGHAVYLGQGGAETLLVAEGVETALSLLTARPDIAAAAALSAGSLAVFTPPPGVARLLIARDNDAPGTDAAERLRARCRDRGTHAAITAPLSAGGDFNDDLRASGAAVLAERLAAALEALHALAEPAPRGGA